MLRAGEHRPEIATGAERPLSAAAAEVARLGQEGYSVALYELLQSVAAESPMRREVQAHLKAIEAFSKSTTGWPCERTDIASTVASRSSGRSR